jgi:hypothetical protein
MAIKSLKELPRGKRATIVQVEKAKKTKAIKTKHRVIGRDKGRLEVSLGTHDKGNVAGVVKGFRQKTKGDIGAILKDSDGNVIARTHIAKGTTTIPEQLVVRALAKYGKTLDQLTVVLTVRTGKRKKKK